MLAHQPQTLDHFSSLFLESTKHSFLRNRIFANCLGVVFFMVNLAPFHAMEVITFHQDLIMFPAERAAEPGPPKMPARLCGELGPMFLLPVPFAIIFSFVTRSIHHFAVRRRGSTAGAEGAGPLGPTGFAMQGFDVVTPGLLAFAILKILQNVTNVLYLEVALPSAEGQAE